MAQCDERPVWSMSGSEMLSALDTYQAEITRLQAARLQVLAALDANGYAAEIGARDTVQLIAVRHRLDTTDVRRDLRLATALPKYPDVNTALNTATATADETADEALSETAGESGSAAGGEAGSEAGGGAGAWVLHAGQAEAIVTALERIPATAMVPVDDLRVAEQQMIQAAQILNPGELRKLGKQVRDTLDTDGPEPAETRALAAETLWLQRSDHGIDFKGYLAAENAELFQTLIFAGSRPHLTTDGQRDPRSAGKRQADALTTILTTAAATGTAAPAHGGIKPHITVTIDLNNLRTTTESGTNTSTGTSTGTGTGTGNSNGNGTSTGTSTGSCTGTGNANGISTSTSTSTGSGSCTGIGSGTSTGTGIGSGTDTGSGTGSGTGILASGATLSAGAVRRLACDAGIIPMVLGTNSEPLDIGTEHRFVTRPIRQALNVRDQGCVICQAPPAMSEAHHLVHWADGGPTAITNMALLCKTHHIEVHQGHWNLHFHQGRPRHTRPTWTNPTPPNPSTPSPVLPSPATPSPVLPSRRLPSPMSSNPGTGPAWFNPGAPNPALPSPASSNPGTGPAWFNPGAANPAPSTPAPSNPGAPNPALPNPALPSPAPSSPASSNPAPSSSVSSSPGASSPALPSLVSSSPVSPNPGTGPT